MQYVNILIFFSFIFLNSCFNKNILLLKKKYFKGYTVIHNSKSIFKTNETTYLNNEDRLNNIIETKKNNSLNLAYKPNQFHYQFKVQSEISINDNEPLVFSSNKASKYNNHINKMYHQRKSYTNFKNMDKGSINYFNSNKTNQKKRTHSVEKIPIIPESGGFYYFLMGGIGFLALFLIFSIIYILLTSTFFIIFFSNPEVTALIFGLILIALVVLGIFFILNSD
jgi:hypothetical protein